MENITDELDAPIIIGESVLMKCQKFLALLNREPDPSGIDATPDGKAKTLAISHVEMSLDELFFGRWGTENYRWCINGNEIQASLDLVCTHPVTNERICRTGVSSLTMAVIPTGEAPAENSKQIAELNFPKLKAECLKNAAQSLGKVFGRDLNRVNKAAFKPLIKNRKRG